MVLSTSAFTISQERALAICPKISSSISIPCSFGIIYEVLYIKRTKGTMTPIHRVLLTMSIVEILASLGASAALHISDIPFAGPTAACQVGRVDGQFIANPTPEQKAKSAAVTMDPNKSYSLDELKAQGEKVYAANCAACHQANGAGLPGVFPAITGSKVTTGPKEAHIAIVMNGKANTAMAPFGKQLNDVDLAAVITYERNALGNKTGDMVQPADIKALRK